jgi:dipeptidyl-peptidase-4
MLRKKLRLGTSVLSQVLSRRRMCTFRATALLALGFAAAVAGPLAVDAQERETAAKLVARTMANPEFRAKTFRGGEWQGSGDFYLDLEPSATAGGTDIVRYQTATGARDILVSASRLIPAGEKTPLPIEDYAFSADGRQLLVFTNSQTVWRQNTRGDYWVLDLKGGALHKLGGDAPASSLMFAKFSLDNAKVGYVRGNNIYVEDLAGGKITRLTQDGSPTVINGTSDWVNEEEFDIRDGFAWSPDSRSIAFWQFNTGGVGIYTLIYDLGAPRGEIVT